MKTLGIDIALVIMVGFLLASGYQWFIEPQIALVFDALQPFTK